MVVLVRVPEDVHIVESLAGNGAPESLSVLDGGDLYESQQINPRNTLKWEGTYSSTRVGTRYGPSCLSDPDPLARADLVDSVPGVLNRLPEDLRRIADSCVLEVGVSEIVVSGKFDRSGGLIRHSPIHANKVRSSNNNIVRTINPRIPGVDVANLSLNTNRAYHAPHIVDAVSKSVRVAVLPVEIFAADGDGENPIFAMSRDGIEQSLLLGFEVVDVFGPDTYEDLHTGVLGRRNGVGESVAVGAGVETD